jgi:predicted aspartyl protease
VSVYFDLELQLVVVSATLTGPSGPVECLLAVDTAATDTHISPYVLQLAGYDPAALFDPVTLLTVGGRLTTDRIRVARLRCLGQTATDFRVICHTVTATTRIDGLLGLDFLRGRVLTLDFVRGRIALRPPRPWWAFWR